MTKKRILVTGAGGPLGVNITRSLRMAPEPLFLLGTDCNSYHLPLALTEQVALIPPASKREQYFAAMRRLIDEHGINMIFPTHPVEVRAMASAGDELPAEVRRFLPPLEVIQGAQDKWLTHQALEAAGVPVPRTYFIQTEQDLERCFDEEPTRPVWVRGAGVPGAGIGVASLPCRELRHASAWVDHFKGWGYMIASQYLPGRNLTWLGLFDDGELVASQSRQRIEYVIPHVSPSGITGAPAVCHTIAEDAISRTGEAAVRALTAKPHGAFFVDLKGDDDDLPRVTEINGGRYGTTVHFYTEAGCNFPYLLVKLAFGEAVEGAPLVNPIAPMTYWIRTLDCGPVLLRPGELEQWRK